MWNCYAMRVSDYEPDAVGHVGFRVSPFVDCIVSLSPSHHRTQSRLSFCHCGRSPERHSSRHHDRVSLRIVAGSGIMAIVFAVLHWTGVSGAVWRLLDLQITIFGRVSSSGRALAVPLER